MYEFPTDIHHPSEVIALLNKMNTRRHAITVDEENSLLGIHQKGKTSKLFGKSKCGQSKSGQSKSGQTKKALYIVNKRDENIRYRKISDGALFRAQSEHHTVYEFPLATDESEVISFVKKIKQRRGAIGEDDGYNVDYFADYLREKIIDDWF